MMDIKWEIIETVGISGGVVSIGGVEKGHPV